MSRKKTFAASFLLLFIFPIMFSTYVTSDVANINYSATSASTFNPIVTPYSGYDMNDNKIHDHLEEMVANGLATSYFTTILTFDEPVTNAIIEEINSLGGEVLTTWEVIYGAAVRIRADRINSLAYVPSVNFITENYKCQKLLSTSVPQINVRPYVWDTLGYEGSSSQTIAVLDTGVDDSHPNLNGGKVTHWKDFIGHDADTPADNYVTATDWDGHGTHCSSIAAGTGDSFGSNATVLVSGTMALPASLIAGSQGYFGHAEVETTGPIHMEIQWNDNSGNSPTDELFIVIDADNNGAFGDGSDIFVHDTYSNMPLTATTGTLSAGYYAFLIGPYTDLGDVSVQYIINRPSSNPSDAHNKYAGVAPGSDIVGVKVLDDTGSGYQANLIDGINWVFTNGLTYDIDVVSMSLGFTVTVPAIDTAINNLVSAGYVTVVAAGNAFLDDDNIGSPGTASKAITVGAIDDVDKIAIYSSNGGSVWKPDVVAPGGAYRYLESTDEDTHPIIAADTTDKDAVYFSGSDTTYWLSEQYSGDYAALQGTSMATPHVAGLVALIIEAMGTDWTHTEADVLLIKNYLCGTATEVRFGEELFTYHNEPTLDRGDVDKVEGFGKVHGDAAIEAFLTEYIKGTEETHTLSSDPDGTQCWARRVELVGGMEFVAGIEVDGSADYDLYLYDPSEDMTTTLGYLEKSTTAGIGLPENIAYTPTGNMTAYIVVKRVSGQGDFTIMAEATNTGTISGFTWPFSIPMYAWFVLGTLGLTSILVIAKRRK